MPLFEISKWVELNNSVDGDLDSSYIVADTVKDLATKGKYVKKSVVRLTQQLSVSAQAEFGLTGPCQIINKRGTIVKDDNILIMLHQQGIPLYVRQNFTLTSSSTNTVQGKTQHDNSQYLNIIVILFTYCDWS